MDWPRFVIETIRDPKWAAETLIAMDLPRGLLYQALIAACALNALVATTSTLINPPAMALPGFLTSPFAYFLLLAGGLVVTIYILFWTGRAMGGQGRFEDVMVTLTWLQVIRFLLQVLVFVMSFIVPALALLIALGAAILGLWLLAHFVSAAMRFDSLIKAFGLLIAAATVLVLGMTLLITLIGGANLGMVPNV